MEGRRGERRLSTAEAAERLGVKPATLYAYVSRGLLTRERAPAGRPSPFHPPESRHLPSPAPPAGAPRPAPPGRPRRGRRPATDLVLPSALTTIAQGIPSYRGLPVPDLAGSRSFEEIATWLWTGQFPDPAPAWRAGAAALKAGRRAQAALPPAALPLERIRVIAAALAAGDELRLELHPGAGTAAGGGLIAGL